jgi:cytochrome c biogenesis protein ResB
MRRILKIVGSPALTFALILSIAAVSVFGTLIEQKRSLEVVYHSPLFILLLAAFGVNLTSCTLLRLRLQLRSLGFLATHIGVLLILVGAVIGGAYGIRGMMQLATDEVSNHFITDRQTLKELPFSIRLNRFSVEYYKFSKYHNFGDLLAFDDDGYLIAEVPAEIGRESLIIGHSIKILDFVPDFVIDQTGEVATRSQLPENPALRVSIRAGDKTTARWLFSNFPGMEHHFAGEEVLPFHLLFKFQERIKSYKSDVSVLNSTGSELLRQTIEVNAPLSYGGYVFYQMDYDEAHYNWSLMQAVRDPGVPVVYAGFCLLTFGIFFILYAKPYLQRKAKKQEEV